MSDLYHDYASDPITCDPSTVELIHDCGCCDPIYMSLLGLTPTCGTGVANPVYSCATAGQLPTSLGNVSVAVDGKPAFVYFYCSAATSAVCSSDQINILTPLDNASGSVQIVVTNNGVQSLPFSKTLKSISPSFLQFGAGPYVTATHAGGNLLGPASLYPGLSTPAKAGEVVLVYGVGFGLPNSSIVNGSSTQTGSLPTLPVCQIGGAPAALSFAGLISPGLYQFNMAVPATAPSGDNSIGCTYGGSATPAGNMITIQ